MGSKPTSENKTDFRKAHPEIFRKRHAISEGAGQALMATTLILISLGAVTFIATNLPGSPWRVQNVASGGSGTPGSSAQGCVGTYSAPSGFTCTTLKVAFVVTNPIASSAAAVASATVITYNPVTLATVEAPATTDSTGTTNSANPYTSGTFWTCKVSASGAVTEYFPCVVPANPSGNSALTTITMPLPLLTLGTYSLTAQVQGGSQWSASAASYSFLNTGLTQITVTWQLQENNNNQGYYSSYNPLKKVNDLLVLELKSASSPKTSVSGCMFSQTINNVYYCQYAIPDGYTTINTGYTQGNNGITGYFPAGSDGRYQAASPSIQTLSGPGNVKCIGSATQQLAGNQALPSGNGGSVSCTTTFYLGSLGSGSTENWTVTLYAYADPVYYDGTGGGAVNGAYGGDQASQSLSPSWSTVTLKN